MSVVCTVDVLMHTISPVCIQFYDFTIFLHGHATKYSYKGAWYTAFKNLEYDCIVIVQYICKRTPLIILIIKNKLFAVLRILYQNA